MQQRDSGFLDRLAPVLISYGQEVAEHGDMLCVEDLGELAGHANDEVHQRVLRVAAFLVLRKPTTPELVAVEPSDVPLAVFGDDAIGRGG